MHRISDTDLEMKFVTLQDSRLPQLCMTLYLGHGGTSSTELLTSMWGQDCCRRCRFGVQVFGFGNVNPKRSRVIGFYMVYRLGFRVELGP